MPGPEFLSLQQVLFDLERYGDLHPITAIYLRTHLEACADDERFDGRMEGIAAVIEAAEAKARTIGGESERAGADQLCATLRALFPPPKPTTDPGPLTAQEIAAYLSDPDRVNADIDDIAALLGGTAAQTASQPPSTEAPQGNSGDHPLSPQEIAAYLCDAGRIDAEAGRLLEQRITACVAAARTAGRIDGITDALTKGEAAIRRVRAAAQRAGANKVLWAQRGLLPPEAAARYEIAKAEGRAYQRGYSDAKRGGRAHPRRKPQGRR